MKIALTGHRPNKLNNEYDLIGPMTDYLAFNLRQIIKHYKPTLIISGMALGADMIWAKLAIESNIDLLAAIPCEGQEKVWPIKSQNLYNEILSYKKCNKAVLSKQYSNTVMQDRNEYMVNNCDKLIVIWDGTSGGTGNCVKYATKVGKDILRIDPKEFYEYEGIFE